MKPQKGGLSFRRKPVIPPVEKPPPPPPAKPRTTTRKSTTTKKYTTSSQPSLTRKPKPTNDQPTSSRRGTGDGEEEPTTTKKIPTWAQTMRGAFGDAIRGLSGTVLANPNIQALLEDQILDIVDLVMPDGYFKGGPNIIGPLSNLNQRVVTTINEKLDGYIPAISSNIVAKIETIPMPPLKSNLFDLPIGYVKDPSGPGYITLTSQPTLFG